MNQQSPLQKKTDKKVVALAVICVLLAASLVGVIAVQPQGSLQTELEEKENTINALRAQIQALQAQVDSSNPTAYVTQIAQLNQQIAALNSTLSNLYSELTELQRITRLEAYRLLYDNTFTQDANASTTIWTDELQYAGYVIIEVSATANTTYAQILYSFADTEFNYNHTIGEIGITVFPVLPGTVQVRIGNINQTETNSVNATAVYYY